jgi:hypothetical protein
MYNSTGSVISTVFFGIPGFFIDKTIADRDKAALTERNELMLEQIKDAGDAAYERSMSEYNASLESNTNKKVAIWKKIALQYWYVPVGVIVLLGIVFVVVKKK